MSRHGSGFGAGDADDTHSVLGEQSNGGDRVVINVGGQKHETYIGTLKNIPDTRLYWITENGTQLPEFDPNTSEFFFDRHPGVFAQILNFYRTGKLHCPNDVCGPLFEDELAFWGIDELQVEPCCWLNYKQHREAQANLNPFDSNNESDGDSVSDMDMSVYGLVADSIRNRNRTWWKKYQPRVWTTFEEPYSSIPAQIVAFITLFLIIVSVVLFCLETVPIFSDPNSTEGQILYILEAICVAWFTLEFVLRLIFCPNKLRFFKKPMNWIDLGAILPFYLNLAVRQSNIKTIVVLRVLRLIRVFRIFKLSRHSYGLQILGHTLKSSCSELFLLVFFLSIGVVIFSSVIYYAERDYTGTHFTTIPNTFWWAVVTMTTLGYGDMVPKTWQGKIVGSLCAVSGVLMIALPVPVIVSNFSLYYSHAKARMKLPRRKRPVIFGAASALRVAQPVVSSEKSPNVITQLIEEGRRVNDDDDSDDNNFVSLRTPRTSGRRSPRASIRPSSPRCRSSINVFTSPPLITKTSHSPRGSMTSPPEALRMKNSLAIPYIQEEIELHDLTSKRNSSLVTERGSEVNLTTSALAISSEPTSPFSSSSVPVSPLATSSMPVNPLATRSMSVTPLASASRTKSPLTLKSSDADSASTCSEVRSPLTDKLKAMPSKSLSADSTTGSPRGRRGRRGSLYIVGFTAKHWQNKALKKSRPNQQSSGGESDRDNARRASSQSRQSVCEKCTQQSSVGSTSTESSSNAGNESTSKATSPTHIHGKDRQLVRVSSGTQTCDESDDADKSKAVDSRDATLLVESSNDSTSKLSEESLVVHQERPRRGSSPLIRQHAVFTFDLTEQEAAGKEPGRRRRYPSGRRSTGAVKKKSSSSPPYPQSRPHSLPSGYINPSYQREEDDLLPAYNENGDTSHTEYYGMNGSVDSNHGGDHAKRSFQPYERPSKGGAPSLNHVIEHRYANPGQVSHESPAHAHVKKPMRTLSLPPGTADKTGRCINHSMSLPLTELHSMYGFAYQAPTFAFQGTTGNEKQLHPLLHPAAQTEPLLQRRQGPLLFLRMLPDPHDVYRDVPPTAEFRPGVEGTSPFHSTLTSPSGGVYVASADDFYNSGHASGFTSAASSGINSAPGSGNSSTDGRFIYPAGYYSYSSSPSSYGAPSSADYVPSMRDFATSPMNFDDGFTALAPRGETAGQDTKNPSSGAYLKPQLHVHKNRSRSWSAPGEARRMSEHEQRLRSQTAFEYELVPVSRVADENGRQYSVYMPSPIPRMLLLPPEQGEDEASSPVERDQERKVPEGDEHAQDDDATVTSGDSRRETPSPASTIRRNSTELNTEHSDDTTSKLDVDLDFRTVDGQSSCSSDITYERTIFPSKSDPAIPISHLDPEGSLDKDSEHRHSFPTRKNGSQPKLQRSDQYVIYNGHEPLQHRTSDSLIIGKRPGGLSSPDRRVSSLPSPDKQRRARAIFFGDSGISSGDSGSMTHSIEAELERDCGEGVTGTGSTLLNPIRETEMENSILQLPVKPDDGEPGLLPVGSSSTEAHLNPENSSVINENLLNNTSTVSESKRTSLNTSDTERVRNSVPTKSGNSKASVTITSLASMEHSFHVIDILNSPELYEASVV